jgi:hypothetical protein
MTRSNTVDLERHDDYVHFNPLYVRRGLLPSD